MTTTRPSAQTDSDEVAELTRKFSFISQKSSRASSLKDGPATSSTAGSNATANSSTQSSRPSIAESSRRRSSLASFSSLLKKSKRQTPTVSEENDLNISRQASRKTTSQTQTFGDKFLDLPTEIQTLVLAFLPISELLSFRRVSKSCLAVMHANPFTITRDALQPLSSEEEDDEPAADFLLHLFPSTYSSTTTDAYFLRTLRRKAVITRQLRVLLTFIQTRVYMLKLNRSLECEHFAPYRPGLRRSLYRPLGYLQHFLETIRHLIIRSHPRHTSPQISIDSCSTCTDSIESTIKSYPPSLLLPIYQIIQLITHHFRTATRSPSSVTAFERKLRGWSYGPPPEQHTSQLILLGNLPELSNIDEMQGSYSKRLSVVKSFADTLAEATRINNIAFPDIYKTRSDPVMTGPTNVCISNEDKHKEDLRTALEAHADDQPLLKSLGPNLNILTEAMLSTVPRVDTFLVGPETLLGRHILAEGLVDDRAELASPYGFVTRVMSESYRSDGTTRQSDNRTDGSGAYTGDGYHGGGGGGGGS